MLIKKASHTLRGKYLVPAQRLAVYEFPEKLAFWALHMAGAKSHADTHDPHKQTDINILDQYGKHFGRISFEPAQSQSSVWVVIHDVTKTGIFKTAIETYLTEVLGVTLPQETQ